VADDQRRSSDCRSTFRARQNYSLNSRQAAHEVNLSLAWDLDFLGQVSPALARSARAKSAGFRMETAKRSSPRFVSDVCRSPTFNFVSSTWNWEIARRNFGFTPGLAADHTNAGKTAGPRPCSTSDRRSNWCSPQPEPFPDLERRIEQQGKLHKHSSSENNPGPVARGRKLTEQTARARKFRAGLPSSLLQRRPDNPTGRSAVDRG